MPESFLLHRCFDPSKLEYEDAPGLAEIKVKIEDAVADRIEVKAVADGIEVDKVPLTKEEQIVAVKLRVLFVRSPKSKCRCNEHVSLRERNKMLMRGTAMVVLRGNAAPSTDKFQWKEIVAVPPGRFTLRATTAGGGKLPFSRLGRQIEHGTDFSNLLPRNYPRRYFPADMRRAIQAARGKLDDSSRLEDWEREARSELAGLEALKTPSPKEADRMRQLTSELLALPAFRQEQNRLGIYEQESEKPMFSEEDHKWRIGKRRYSGFSADATLTLSKDDPRKK
jgi:hypothetical protein